jgi:hypothetical protein
MKRNHLGGVYPGGTNGERLRLVSRRVTRNAGLVEGTHNLLYFIPRFGCR